MIKSHARVILYIFIFALFFGCAHRQLQKNTPKASNGIISSQQSSNVPASSNAGEATIGPSPSPSFISSPPPTDLAGTISVHFISVGKADSILIKASSSAMLIDAGTPDMAGTVVNYLKSHGITKLDYVIGTHSHIDHIGGMGTVLSTFPTAMIIMPKVPDNSDVYQNLIKAVGVMKLKWTQPKVGNQYDLGNAKFTILAPNTSDYKNFNNYSVVIRLVYGSTSFLLTGDALTLSENEMMSNGLPISSTLLKVGHHGGGSSSSLEFLKAVKPKFAILSVDTSKKGYPSDKILQRLASLGISIFRTDEAGTIVATSDGQTITLDKAPSIIAPKPTKAKKK